MASRMNFSCPAVDELKNEGVTISYEIVGLPEDPFVPGDRLGKLHPTACVKMQVSVRRRESLPPVVAFGNQDACGKVSVDLLTEDIKGENAVYTWVFPMREHRDFAIPAWPQNRIHILVEGPGGKYDLYLIGLFAQENKTWAWAEKSSSGFITRSDEGIVIETPSIIWAELIGQLAARGHYEGRPLKPATGKSHVGPQVPLEALQLEPGTGLTQYFNMFMGTGYAWFKDGEGEVFSVKIHYSSLPPGQHGIRRLTAGQIVSGKLSVREHTIGPDKGKQLLELRNVKVLTD